MFPLSNDLVETPDALSDALVRLGFQRAQYELQCTVVVEEMRRFGHHKLRCARNRNVVDDKRRRCPLRKNGGGLPKQHDVCHGILACRVKIPGGRALGGYG